MTPVHAITVAKSTARWIRAAYRNLQTKRPLRSNDLKLHLGCGQRRLGEFINIDRNLSKATNYVADIRRLPAVRSESVIRIEAYHVIEHISESDALKADQRWHALLEPGGTLVLECPDFDQDIRDYLAGNSIDQRLGSIFGLHRFPGDSYLWGYNAERLKGLMELSAFHSSFLEPPTDSHSLVEPCLRIVATK